MAWEPEVLACLLSLFNMAKAVHFLDLGANIGFYSLALPSIIGEIQSTAVEPTPETAATLSRLAKKNGIDVEIINKAVSTAEGFQKFYMIEGNSRNSLIGDSENCIEVETTSLDSIYVNKYKIIKMDTEGTECDVIKSGMKSIQEHKPYIVLEVIKASNAEGIKELLNDYYLYHLKKDFSVVRFDEFIDAPKRGEWNWLLSPHELPQDFFAFYAKWIDRIKETGNFFLQSYIDKQEQMLNMWKYVDFNFMEYVDFIRFPIRKRHFYAFHHRLLPKEIHYEFLISNSKMCISLHFETKSRLDKEIADHIVLGNILESMPSTLQKQILPGGEHRMYFSLPLSYEYECINNYVLLMKKFIKLTIGEVIQKYTELTSKV